MDNKPLLFGGIGLVIVAVLVFIKSHANANPTATVTTAQPIVPTITGPSLTDVTSSDALQQEIVSIEQELANLGSTQGKVFSTVTRTWTGGPTTPSTGIGQAIGPAFGGPWMPIQQ